MNQSSDDNYVSSALKDWPAPRTDAFYGRKPGLPAGDSQTRGTKEERLFASGLEQELDLAQRERDRFRIEFSNETARSSSLTQQVTALSESVAFFSSEATNVRAERDRLKQELAGCRESIAKLDDKRRHLLGRLRESVGDTRELNDLSEALVAERDDLRTRIAQLEKVEAQEGELEPATTAEWTDEYRREARRRGAEQVEAVHGETKDDAELLKFALWEVTRLLHGVLPRLRDRKDRTIAEWVAIADKERVRAEAAKEKLAQLEGSGPVAPVGEAEQMIAWLGDPSAAEDRFDEVQKFWREGESVDDLKEAFALAMMHSGQPLKHRPSRAEPASVGVGRLPLNDYDLNYISAAIFRAFYNEVPPYGSKHSQNAINQIILRAYEEAQVNPNRPANTEPALPPEKGDECGPINYNAGLRVKSPTTPACNPKESQS